MPQTTVPYSDAIEQCEKAVKTRVPSYRMNHTAMQGGNGSGPLRSSSGGPHEFPLGTADPSFQRCSKRRGGNTALGGTWFRRESVARPVGAKLDEIGQVRDARVWHEQVRPPKALQTIADLRLTESQGLPDLRLRTSWGAAEVQRQHQILGSKHAVIMNHDS